MSHVVRKPFSLEANKGGNQPSGQQRVNDNSADQAMQKCSQVCTFVQIQQKQFFLWHGLNHLSHKIGEWPFEQPKRLTQVVQ